MNIIYHKKIRSSDLPSGSIAETYLSCVEITDVNSHAKNLITEISDTSWISKLEPVAKLSYENKALETIKKLVAIFRAVDNKIKEDFGEYMISMSSGHCLQIKQNHMVLPLSELWKPKLLGNEGFDFHTLSPFNKFSFGEAKFTSSGNAYGSAAEQTYRFSKEDKDKRDAVHLRYFSSPIAIKNLEKNRRGFIVAFSINSKNHESILKNSLKNEDIKRLAKCCDELYIIGVKS